MAGFQNNFTEMFLLCPLTKIAKMVPFGLTKWPPELKTEKGHRLMRLSTVYLKDISPLNRLMDFEVILQEFFLSDPLPNG